MALDADSGFRRSLGTGKSLSFVSHYNQFDSSISLGGKMDSQSIGTDQPAAIAAGPQEIQHVPLWVKGIVVAGAILFAIQLPDFKSSLSDSIQKDKAAAAEKTGQYVIAIDLYKDLRSRYPNDKNLKKQLGFAQYHAARYIDALNTFDLLAGVKMPKREVEEINVVIADITAKLQLKIK